MLTLCILSMEQRNVLAAFIYNYVGPFPVDLASSLLSILAVVSLLPLDVKMARHKARCGNPRREDLDD